MTNEQKMMELLKEVGLLIKEKNDLISLRNYQLEDLKQKLKKLENDTNSIKA